MVTILDPLSIWIQLGNFFFTLSGVFGDLLVIRFCLVMAYVALFINAATGDPLWPDVHGTKGSIGLDGMIWAMLNLYVHGYSMVCLFLDERKVDLDEDIDALWRMFYRMGGLSRCLFHAIVASRVHVVEFNPDEIIPTDDHIYILYLGQVHLNVYKNNEYKSDRILLSGDLFDIKYLGIFSSETPFESNTIRCTSITKTKLFRIHRNDMEKISSHPFAKSFVQTLLIENLSSVVASCLEGVCRSTLGEHECDQIFRPLRPWEEPKKELSGSEKALKNALGHLMFYMKASFAAPYPFGRHSTGIRQTNLPAPPFEEELSYPSAAFLKGRPSISTP